MKGGIRIVVMIGLLVHGSSSLRMDLDGDGEEACLCRLPGEKDSSSSFSKIFRHQGQLLRTCQCSIDRLQNLNHRHVNPLLSSLVKSPWFRYFRVDLSAPCSLFPADDKCLLPECAAEEVPSELEMRLSAIDRDIDAHHIPAGRKTEQLDVQWTQEDVGETHFIDLLANPEQYTGYKGNKANRVWKAMYNQTYPDDDMLEHRVFNHLLSGLHTSISVHIAKHYLIASPDQWGVDLDEYQRRVTPERLANMHFLYLLVLNAIRQGAETLSSFDYGEQTSLVNEFLALRDSWPLPTESLHMFEQGSEQKEDFRQHFFRLSQVADCIGCFRCRLWGKLQLKGLGTALRLLFSPESSSDLLKNDVVALINLAHCLSDSVEAVSQMQPLLHNVLIDGSNNCIVFSDGGEKATPMQQFGL